MYQKGKFEHDNEEKEILENQIIGQKRKLYRSKRNYIEEKKRKERKREKKKTSKCKYRIILIIFKIFMFYLYTIKVIL